MFWRVGILGVTMVVLAGCTLAAKPLSYEETTLAAQRLRGDVTRGQEPVNGPIGLYEAMARALKYNLDTKVELLEQALRIDERNLKHYDLLPALVADLDYSNRDNNPARSQRDFATGVVEPPTTTTERDQLAARLELSWDVVDFGLAYVRARQSADEVLIAEENKRRIVNRIIEDVRTAYWRAVSAERLVRHMQGLEDRVARALSNAQALSDDPYASKLTALTYQRELISIQRDLQRYRRELTIAKVQLAALMNIDPGTPYRVHVPERVWSASPILASTDEMISVALKSRPELRELQYRLRINDREIQAAVLERMPSLRWFFAKEYSHNELLLNQNWLSWGSQISWNLIQVFSHPARRRVIDAQKMLLEQRALALTMAVMTQVHVSRARYDFYRNELETAARYHSVQQRILKQIREDYSVNKVSEQTLIREEMNGIAASVRFDIAFADLQNAYANIYASLGTDPYGEDLRGDETVGVMAASLRRAWAKAIGS